MEVTNRTKGLDRTDRLNAWKTKDQGSLHCTWGGDQNHLQEKEMQKGKTAIWVSLTNSWEKKKSERQRRKAKIYPPECKVPKNSKERYLKESLPKWMKRNKGKQEKGRN